MFLSKKKALLLTLAAFGFTRERSDVGSEVDEFVKQNVRLRQHPLDLIGRLADRARGGVDSQFTVGRRLVIVSDPGKRLQCSGARLGIMALGIAALANLARGGDIDLPERCIGPPARGSAILAGW